MPFLKNCRVSYKRTPSENDPEASFFTHSVLMEDKVINGALLFESGAIAEISPDDLSSRRLYYTKVADGCACLGVLTLSSVSVSGPIGPTCPSYLVIATNSVSLGKFTDHEVFRITAVQFISLLSTNYEDDSLSEIRKLLSSGAFLYARSSVNGAPYDFTMNTQMRYLNLGQPSTADLYLRSNTELNYLWNGGLLTPLLQWGINVDVWCVSIICGSFEACTIYCGPSQVRMGVVSRVSSRRPGTRFHARGVDDRGHVANFVETEQFIYHENVILSHIQLRGTVPLFWEQPGLQVGSHKIQLSRSLDISLQAYERHFKHILSQYSDTAIVSLVGSKLGEGLLGRSYQELHSRSCFKDSIAQIVMDYHAEVQSRGQQCLDWLQNQLNRFIDCWGFFRSVDGHVEQCQTGALRINCVDCLDRTNAVQTLVGIQLVLPRMLNALNDSLSPYQPRINRFVDSLRQVWQQNGDQVSRIYAGTGALGSGRSRLRDVQRSAARTLQHSLFDSAKQDAMRTLLRPSGLDRRLQLIAKRYLPRQFQLLPRSMLFNLMERSAEFTSKYEVRIFVGTWNVNGGKHFHSVAHKHESVTDWLLNLPKTVRSEDDWGYRNPTYSDQQIAKPIDIFAIGFEEIVDLTTSNIVAGSKSTTHQRDWGCFLQSQLNKTAHTADPYILVGSVQLVGVCLFVFVRSRLAIHLRDLAVASVKTGLGGTAGNKGGVAFSCQLGCTSICFVCSHFAAGQNAVAERNEDFNEIYRRLVFQNGLNISSHDYVFWCGDFNYRINLSANEVKRLVSQSAWLDLLRSDQLTLERQAGTVFKDFDEGMVRFAPTYKYDLFCDDYDTSEKCRAPAWTDRVLWRHRPLMTPKSDFNETPVKFDGGYKNTDFLVIYNRAELKTSDHRPVAAIFDIDIHVVSPESRRGVSLDVFKSYGPINATIQLTMRLVESVSRTQVPLENLPINPFRRNDFIKILKTLGSSRNGVVLIVHFDSTDTAFLIYSDARQAAAASDFFDGYSTAWPSPVGLPQIGGGYEIHFRSKLKSCVGIVGTELIDIPSSFDWETFLDKAETEEAADQGPTISNDAFETLTPDTGEASGDVELDGAVNLASDLTMTEDLVFSGETIPRKIPPRPAPPSRPPAPIVGLTSCCRRSEVADNRLLNREPESSLLNNALEKSYSFQSASSSPSHKGIANSASGGANLLLFSPPIDKQVVSSCIDLFSASDESLSQISDKLADKPISSTNLTTLPNSHPPSTLAPDRPAPPPPPPRRKPPIIPPPSTANTSQFTMQCLSVDDPFTLVDDLSSGVAASDTTEVSNPNIPNVDLDSPFDCGLTPNPPPRTFLHNAQSSQ